MTNLAFRSAREQAAAIATRQVSSVELLEHYLARIGKYNSALNAVVTLAEERARSQARAADDAIARGESRGPLHGVPMTVKDAFEVEGVRSTSGSTRYANHVPDRDATTVQRLKGAGAIIFGKTNLPADTRDWQTFNDVFGRTDNPWDESRTPGGSSGGSAAALAAGLTSLELGGDTAGSIRVPSHYCGVYGLKTSFEIVPTRGHIPGPPGTLGTFDLSVVGPMGRHADDLDLALDVLVGPSEDRSVAWRLDLPPAKRRTLADYRVAAWLDDTYCTVDGDVLDLLNGVVEELRTEGASVTETAGPVGLEETMEVYAPLLLNQGGLIETEREFAALVQLASQGVDTADRRQTTAKHMTMRVREWHRLDEVRHRIRGRWAGFFESFDVLICPIAPTPAIPHDSTADVAARRILVNGQPRPYRDHMPWVSVASLAFLPAAAAPIGTTRDGLPVGIQVIAPYLHDRTAVDFVRQLAVVTGGFVPPPRYA